MDSRKRTSLIGIITLLVCAFAMLLPVSAPTASAHALTPHVLHNTRQLNGNGPRNLAIPLSAFSNCNFDGPDQFGFFLCGVENVVAPGCLRERITPVVANNNLTGNCFRAGTILSIACQLRGGQVNNTNVWDLLQDGAFVTDFFMDTSGFNGAFSPPIPQC